MKQILPLLLVLMGLSFSYEAYSQSFDIDSRINKLEVGTKVLGDDDPEKSKFWDKIVVGGNLGGSYRNGWNINVSPNVGYRITPKFIAGLGISYVYSQFVYADRSKSIFNVTGGRAFVRHFLFAGVYGLAEYEYLKYNVFDKTAEGLVIPNTEFSATLPGLNLGAGYTTNFGAGFGLSAEAVYNFLWDPLTSPFNSPWQIRGGINFGF